MAKNLPLLARNDNDPSPCQTNSNNASALRRLPTAWIPPPVDKHQ